VVTNRLRGLRPRTARRAVEVAVSQRTWLRGRWREDGAITLLTVDFQNLSSYALRLGASFRRAFGDSAPVVVVQNGARRNNRVLRRAGFTVRGFATNLGHGRALDWGLRSVTTQYVLICDPDSFILTEEFRTQVMERVTRFGVAGILVSEAPFHQYYHPICLAFETRLWKQSAVSFIDGPQRSDRPYDVGAAFTTHVGGIVPGALIPETQRGIAGHVFGGSFTNTWGASRITLPENSETIDGRSAEVTRGYHVRWNEWVDRVAAGRDDVTGFPIQ
jgi:hypothetical protein